MWLRHRRTTLSTITRTSPGSAEGHCPPTQAPNDSMAFSMSGSPRTVSSDSSDISPPLPGVRVRIVSSSGLPRAMDTMYCAAAATPPARSPGCSASSACMPSKNSAVSRMMSALPRSSLVPNSACKLCRLMPIAVAIAPIRTAAQPRVSTTSRAASSASSRNRARPKARVSARRSTTVMEKSLIQQT